MSVHSEKIWMSTLTVILSIHCTTSPTEPSNSASNGDNNPGETSSNEDSEAGSNSAENSSADATNSASGSDSEDSASEDSTTNASTNSTSDSTSDATTTSTDTNETTGSSSSEESSASDSSTDSSSSDSTADTTTDTTADDATGSSDSETSSSTDSGTDSSSDTTDGTPRFRVEGVVRRVVEPFAGNDGIGMLYTSLQETCGDASTTIASFKGMADLSTTSSETPFLFEDIPDGTWYVAGFLDDDENADASAPAPSKGDIVAAEGTGPGCVEVVVSGADAKNAVLELNLALPF